QTITITYDASGLGFGVYNGTVTINSNGGNLTIPVTIGVTSVGVEDEPVDGEEFALHTNYPNPFTETTTISYTLDQAYRLRVTVYDLNGRVVRQLVDRRLPQGKHEVTWDARDGGGKAVAAGVYLAVLQAKTDSGEPGIRKTQKIMVRK
ncbi:MAG: T9SS type A sorting domain-containing protein, partial [Rhodothermales bacterium]|nr:T9SS type A sorting domain-containing protein [Rhodothermales bacterium]